MHGDNSKWIILLISLFAIAMILKYLIDKNKVVPFLHHEIGSRQRFGLRNTKKVPKIEIISEVTISLRSKWQKYNKYEGSNTKVSYLGFAIVKKSPYIHSTIKLWKASSF